MYTKILKYSLIVAAIMSISFLLSITYVNQNSWNDLKNQYTVTREGQIEHYINNLEDGLKFIAEDHLLKTLIKDYANNEALLDGYFNRLMTSALSGVDFILFENAFTDEITVYGRKEAEKLRDLPLYTQLESNTQVDVVMIDQVPTLVVVSRIEGSNLNTKQGTIVVAKQIDSEVIYDIEQFLDHDNRSKVSIVSTMDEGLESDFSQIHHYFKMSQSDEIYAHLTINTPELESVFYEGRNVLLIIVCIIVIITLLLLYYRFKKASDATDKAIDLIKEVSESDYKELISLDSKIYGSDMLRLADAINQMSQGFNRKITDLDNHYYSMIDLIANAIEINDAYTSFHNQSVANYAKVLGKAVAFEDMESLIIAARLHDIGKIGIPTQILNKNGSLTKEEFIIVKRHPQIGFQLLNSIAFFEKAKFGIKYHHERWDGTGYPDGLKGEEIPMIAQIISVADVFDALTSDRPYRQAMEYDEAMAIILENKGKMFNPELVEAFHGILGKMIDDGDYGCVLDLQYDLDNYDV